MSLDLQNRMMAAVQAVYGELPLVFGEGPADRPLLTVIGEAPGAEEEKLRRPFVGKAGKNLDLFLATLGLPREAVYITNLVKLHPTKISKAGREVNRPPTKAEVALFAPFLQEELSMVAPQFIATLGNFPLKAVLGDDKATIGDCHGRLIELGDGRRIFPLYHPAAIIYNQSLKAVYESDLVELKKVLNT